MAASLASWLVARVLAGPLAGAEGARLRALLNGDVLAHLVYFVDFVCLLVAELEVWRFPRCA